MNPLHSKITLLFALLFCQCGEMIDVKQVYCAFDFSIEQSFDDSNDLLAQSEIQLDQSFTPLFHKPTTLTPIQFQYLPTLFVRGPPLT